MFGVVLNQMNKYGRIAMCGSISVYNEKKDLKDVKGIFYNPLNLGITFIILLQLICCKYQPQTISFKYILFDARVSYWKLFFFIILRRIPPKATFF